MNNNLLSYIYDFLSVAFENKDIMDMIKEVILFGSVAKDSYDKSSDIDLFFDVRSDENIKIVEDALKGAVKSFEVKAEKTWRIKGIKLPIRYIAGALGSKTWENIKEEIISSGIVLYGAYKEIPNNLKHNYLLHYSLANFKPKDKMRFLRQLTGYNLKKGKKEYIQEGLLKKIKGTKLSSNVILVPVDNLSNVKDFFEEFKIPYNIMETWIRI